MHKDRNPEQPIQRCMTERPEVSRGHSTAKGIILWKTDGNEQSGKG